MPSSALSTALASPFVPLSLHGSSHCILTETLVNLISAYSIFFLFYLYLFFLPSSLHQFIHSLILSFLSPYSLFSSLPFPPLFSFIPSFLPSFLWTARTVPQQYDETPRTRTGPGTRSGPYGDQSEPRTPLRSESGSGTG